MKRWTETINTIANGRFVIEHYGPGEIVTELDFMEATAMGTVEMTSGDYSKGGEFPVGAPYASMPGGVNLMEWVSLDFDHGGNEFLQDKVYGPVGIKYLGGIPQTGCVLNTNRPIKSLSDVKGMKIRDFGLKGELCAKMGFTIEYVPFPEVYMAISTGVVEGQSQLRTNIVDMSFYEVAPYITLPDVVPYLGAGAWCNLEAFNALPPDLQMLVAEGFKIWSYDFARFQIYSDGVKMREFVEHGGEVFTFSDEDVAAIKKMAVEVWNEAAAKDPISAEFIDMYKDYMVEIGYEIPS